MDEMSEEDGAALAAPKVEYIEDIVGPYYSRGAKFAKEKAYKMMCQEMAGRQARFQREFNMKTKEREIRAVSMMPLLRSFTFLTAEELQRQRARVERHHAGVRVTITGKRPRSQDTPRTPKKRDVSSGPGYRELLSSSDLAPSDIVFSKSGNFKFFAARLGAAVDDKMVEVEYYGWAPGSVTVPRNSVRCFVTFPVDSVYAAAMSKQRPKDNIGLASGIAQACEEFSRENPTLAAMGSWEERVDCLCSAAPSQSREPLREVLERFFDAHGHQREPYFDFLKYSEA